MSKHIAADLHTHTKYSDGKSTIIDNINAAREKNIKYLAITDHSYGCFLSGNTKKQVKKAFMEIEGYRETFKDINLLFGVELNLNGVSGKLDLCEEVKDLYDILLFGFHLPVFPHKFSDIYNMYYNAYLNRIFKIQTKNQIRKNTKAYIRAIERYPVDILTHINYNLKVDLLEVAKACCDKGVYMEISTRHNQRLTQQDIDAVLSTNVEFVLNSDAHNAHKIGVCDKAWEIVDKFNIPHERIANLSGRKLFLRSQDYKELQL